MNKKNKMEKIIIQKKKNKFYIYLFLTLAILIGVLIMSIYWFHNPSKYVYWFLPTKEYVFIVAATGIVFSVFGFFLIYFNLIDKKYRIEISNEGLFLGNLPYENKFIKWNEIELVEQKKISGNKYLVIFVKDVNDKLRIEKNFIRRISFLLNLKTQGTPYLVNCKLMNCSSEYLFEIILSYWEKYGVML